jgi:hypothetical protein
LLLPLDIINYTTSCAVCQYLFEKNFGARAERGRFRALNIL